MGEETQYGPALPDMAWINRQVPILELARELGLPSGRKITCPECRSKRLTFSPRLNLWRCWKCDPNGERKSPLDLVMFILDLDVYHAAVWIGERWAISSKVQPERTQSERGVSKPVFSQMRRIPVKDKSKPSLPALVTSMGWTRLSSRARLVAVLLFAAAQESEDHTFTISRAGLADWSGIRQSNGSWARINRELEDIGLFAVDRGLGGRLNPKLTTYRLTWWSKRWQSWLDGEAIKDTPLRATSNKVPYSPRLNFPEKEPSVS